MNTAVGSVVYKQGVEYISDFLESLKNQSVQNFSIVLLNDDIEGDFFEEKFSYYIRYFGNRMRVFSTQEESRQSYSLRVELLKIVKRLNVDLFVLCDCDDKCARNRVEENQKKYDENYSFLYNEFRSFDGREIMPTMPDITDRIAQIYECNYLGLSNTALIMNKISSRFVESLNEGRTPIFDWYLFSRIILEGGVGRKVSNTATYYRIYQDNLVGIPDNTFKELEKELEIKKRHYELLEKYDSKYSDLIKKYDTLNVYEYINRGKKENFWWGQLQNI